MDRLTSMTAFATVVASGSFTAAAQRLNLSPAAVTTHVRSLEERLGARLLNRTTRKLSLTEAGRTYYEHCARILADIEAADGAVSALNSAPRGTLRLNAATVLCSGLVSLIGEFGAAYPDVIVELIATDQMIDLVKEGMDLAIRFNQPPESSLVVRRLGVFRIFACAASAYLEKHGTPREPADLSRHNCLAYMHPGYTALTREWHLVGPEGDVIVPVSGNLHTNSAEIIRSAAIQGRGITLSPSFVVDEAVRTGKLVQVLPDHHLGEFPIIALFPHREHMPAKVRSFVDFAAKHFAADPNWRLPPPRRKPMKVVAAR
jgi:DNA-binding transcriptional LysR family regulator